MYEHDDRTILVPKSKARPGFFVHDYYEHPDLFELYEFPADEFWNAYDAGFFNAMNDKYSLMLDDFEGDYITEDLGFVLSEAGKIKDICPTLYEAASAAAGYGTSISFNL